MPPDSESGFFLIEHLGEAEMNGRSVSRADFRSMPWMLSDETRLSVVAPLESRVAFTLDVPAESELRFATALLPLGGASETEWAFLRNVSFQVHVEGSKEKETVFDEVVPRRRAGTWIERKVPLGAWSGDEIRLELVTRLPRRFLQDPGTLRAAREQFLAAWGNPVVDSRAANAAGTNVILISLDCVRFDHLGVYGRPEARTPNLDTFAEDGVVFETAMTTAPSTLPSHMSMFTGMTPLVHGANKWRSRDARAPYLPALLSSLGFEVNAVVTGPYVSQVFGFAEGFHTYRFMDDARAGLAVDAALEVLDRASRRRQFLFLHLFDAHTPYAPPRAFLPEGMKPPRMTARMRRVLAGDVAPTDAEKRELQALYASEIAYLDAEVGRFFTELRSRGLYGNSLIVVTADHGEAFHEHGFLQHSRVLYEEITRVPLIVKWPFDSPKGVAEALVSHIDILPTVLEEAGAGELVDGLGVSLRRLAAGSDVQGRKVISEFEWLLERETVMKIAIRGVDFKYIATFEAEPGSEITTDHMTDEELYSLVEDPGETRNLVSEDPESGDAFREVLVSYLKTVHLSRRAGEEIEVDEETRKRLESLGYVY